MEHTGLEFRNSGRSILLGTVSSNYYKIKKAGLLLWKSSRVHM